MLAGGAVLLIAVGVVSFLFVWENPRRTGPAARGPREPVPTFSFNLKGVRALTTGARKQPMRRARHAAKNIRETLDRLYLEGFVDPNAWRTGRYGDVWPLFTPHVVDRARAEVRTLTLGPRAGDVYDQVIPRAGKLKVRVLLDRGGHPSTAVATVDFLARAEAGETTIAITSEGQFFLRPRHDAWSIYAYDLDRGDRPRRSRTPQRSPSP